MCHRHCASVRRFLTGATQLSHEGVNNLDLWAPELCARTHSRSLSCSEHPASHHLSPWAGEVVSSLDTRLWCPMLTSPSPQWEEGLRRGHSGTSVLHLNVLEAPSYVAGEEGVRRHTWDHGP